MSLPILPESAESSIINSVKTFVEDTGASGAVLGLSGGIDSSLTAYLASRALGSNRVLGIMMPEERSCDEDLEHAHLIADILGIEYVVADITEIIDAFEAVLPAYDTITGIANVKCRTRMIILFYFANGMRCVVLGSMNKSELMTGYFTKFGDGATDFLPLGDLFKTHVRELAERVSIPKIIRDKPPSAGLFEGQTDEEELGISYELIDPILHGIESGISLETIVEENECSVETVRGIFERILHSEHKRNLSGIAKVF